MEVVEGLPTVEARVIKFVRILEERIFNSYLLFTLLFIVSLVEPQSINPAVGKGEGQNARKKKQESQERGGVAVGER